MAYISIYNKHIIDEGTIEEYNGQKFVLVTEEMCAPRHNTWCQNSEDHFALLTNIYPGDFFFIINEADATGYRVSAEDFVLRSF